MIYRIRPPQLFCLFDYEIEIDLMVEVFSTVFFLQREWWGERFFSSFFDCTLVRANINKENHNCPDSYADHSICGDAYRLNG